MRLMPSSTGEPGGARTGQKMSDYPIDGGPFLVACTDLVEREFSLSWLDEEVDPNSIYERAAIHKPKRRSPVTEMLYTNLGEFFHELELRQRGSTAVQKRKVKYCCPTCETNVWGKRGLTLLCGMCGIEFEAVEN
jgi:hypothetical protein